jgi:plastocyanin
MHMIRRLVVVGVLAVSLSCGGGSGGGTGPTPPPSAITIHLTATGVPAFKPARDTIAAGGVVTWVWDDGDHNITAFSVNGSPTFPTIATQPTPYQTQTVIPTVGLYHFYCSNHGTSACAPGDMCGAILAK